jgi:hypothetical protein
VILVMSVFSLEAESDLSALLPQNSQLADWNAKDDPEYYSPATLYEYIDGEAELYHRYGFIELISQTYYETDSEESSITVNLYRMGSLENAFGIYASYRYPDYQFEEIGVEAMVSEYGIKFYQDQYFVDISSWDTGENYDQGMRAIAALISKHIGGEKNPPAIIRFLPQTHRVPKSLKYFSKEMLNQSFLGAGIEAEYQIDLDHGTGFVIFCESDSLAENAVNRIRTAYLEMGDSLILPENPRISLMLKNSRNQYFMMQPIKTMIFGTRGFYQINSGEALIQEMNDGFNLIYSVD